MSGKFSSNAGNPAKLSEIAENDVCFNTAASFRRISAGSGTETAWLDSGLPNLTRGISQLAFLSALADGYLPSLPTTVTILFDIENHVLVGQVATCAAARGSGYARDFLHWLANQLQQQGKYAVLYALDIRVSFYQEIGFEAADTEWVLERSDIEKEDVTKGALQ